MIIFNKPAPNKRMVEDNPISEQEPVVSKKVKLVDILTLLRNSQTLFTKTFLQGRAFDQLSQTLELKAVLFHCLMTFFRVLFFLSSSTFWQRGIKLCSKITQEDVSTGEMLINIMSVSIITVGLLSDLLVWKRRHLAQALLPIELSSLISLSFLPFNCGSTANSFLLSQMVITYILVSVRPARDVVLCTGTYLIMSFCTTIYTYPDRWTTVDIQDKIANAILCPFILAIIALTLYYLAELKTEITEAQYDNSKVLSGIKEAVVVIRENSDDGDDDDQSLGDKVLMSN